MRYVYGITSGLLLAGAAASLTGAVNAQVAQNEPGAIQAAAPRAGAPMSFADLAARLQPAVVNISTTQTVETARPAVPPGFEDFFRRFGGEAPGGGAPARRQASSLGSGFIISADGYVVTNNHVIAPGARGATVDEITVTLANRREYKARVVGRDTASDLAVLKIEASGLPFVRLGNSDQVRVGDWVVSIGNPFGLGGTVTAGIVSAINRVTGQAGAYDRYIQTDAAINQGNSGGPLFDLQGNVVGINTLIFSPTGGNIGLGFSIPAEQARPVIDSLRSRGAPPDRGYLGVVLQPIDEGVASALGLPRDRGELIRRVEPNEAAARAGIQTGDVVVRVAGRDVTPQESLSYIVARQPVGARIPVELIRDGRRLTVTAVVGRRPSDDQLAARSGEAEEDFATQPERPDAAPSGTRASIGLSVQAITPGIARSLRIPETTRGVVVGAVDPNSDAAQEGIQRGDVILSVNRQAVTTPEAAAAAVEAARRANRESVLLLVQRGAQPPAFFGVDLVRR